MATSGGAVKSKLKCNAEKGQAFNVDEQKKRVSSRARVLVCSKCQSIVELETVSPRSQAAAIDVKDERKGTVDLQKIDPASLSRTFSILQIVNAKGKWKPTTSRCLRVSFYLVLFFIWSLIMAAIFIRAEKDAVDDQIQRKKDLETEFMRILNYEPNSEEWKSFKEKMYEHGGLPDKNWWKDFQWVLRFTGTIGSTVGFGTFCPATPMGKACVIFGGTIAIMICLNMFVEFFLLDKVFFKIIIRALDHFGIFIPNSMLNLVHFLLVSVYLLIFSAILAAMDETDDLGDWSKLDYVYAYFQLWTTIGFGDYAIWEQTQSSSGLINAIALPIFFFGVSMFPVWLISLTNIFESIFAWVITKLPCCPDDISKEHKLDGGLEMTRQDVYESQYNVMIKKSSQDSQKANCRIDLDAFAEDFSLSAFDIQPTIRNNTEE